MKKVCGQGRSSPCYKDGVHCLDRTVGCHATCEKYMKWWNFHNEVVYPNRRENAKLMNYIAREKIKSINRGGGKR